MRGFSWGDIICAYAPPKGNPSIPKNAWKSDLVNQRVYVGVFNKNEGETICKRKNGSKAGVSLETPPKMGGHSQKLHPWRSAHLSGSSPGLRSSSLQLGLSVSFSRSCWCFCGSWCGDAWGIVHISAFSDTCSVFTSVSGEPLASLLEGIFQFRGICFPCACYVHQQLFLCWPYLSGQIVFTPYFPDRSSKYKEVVNFLCPCHPPWSRVLPSVSNQLCSTSGQFIRLL